MTIRTAITDTTRRKDRPASANSRARYANYKKAADIVRFYENSLRAKKQGWSLYQLCYYRERRDEIIKEDFRAETEAMAKITARDILRKSENWDVNRGILTKCGTDAKLLCRFHREN